MKHIIFLLCFSTISYGQIDYDFIDSLREGITESIDTNQVNLHYQLGVHYSENDSIQKALFHLKRGIDLGESTGFHSRLASLYQYLGVAYDLAGELQQSLAAYDQAKYYYQKLPNSDYHLTHVEMNIGIAHFFSGDHSTALKHYLTAYEDAKTYELEEMESKLVNNIGVIYRKLERYDDALHFYKQSLYIKLRNNNLEGAGASYQNIGLCYSHINQLDSAIWYLNKSKSTLEDANVAIKEIRLVEFNIANAHYEVGQIDTALPLLEGIKSKNYEYLPDNYKFYCMLFLGNIYRAQNRQQSALKMYNDAEGIFKNTSFNSGLLELYDSRAKVQKDLGYFDKSVLDFEKTISLMEEMNSNDKKELEVDMLAKYETLQKEAEIERLALEDELNQTRINQQRYGLWGLGAGIALLSFLFYRLFNQKKQIDIQNQEKEILLKEIHHRVKNNLQVISSLLKLQSRNVTDANTKRVLTEGQNRVRSMALIHQNLYNEDELTGISMPKYLKELGEELIENYTTEHTVQLKMDVDEILLDVDTVVPIGLIINELITNALKYAFVGIDNPMISLVMKKHSEYLYLEISDNGIGFDQNKQSDESLGMKLIRSFAKRLKADYQLETSNGTKATFKIKDYS